MSQFFKARGTVAAILPVDTYPSGFQKQTLVLDDGDPRYPQRVAFDFMRERVLLLQGLRAAQEIEVTFSLSGHEYNGKHFVSLRGISVATVTAAPVQGGAPTAVASPTPAAAAAPAPAATPAAAAPQEDDLSNLPF